VQLTVRPAQPTDAEQIARVDIDSHVAAYSHIFGTGYPQGASIEAFVERWQRIIRGEGPPGQAPECLLVAEVEGRVEGYCGLMASRDDDGDGVGEVAAIYVSPQHWRGGIGSALMAAGEDYLRGRGFTEATLWVLEDNDLGRGFYDRLGWTADGDRRDRPGRNELRYRKRLDVQ
jgi:ribosomal protein S18 acetylase RimI-like enzyme